MSDPIRIAITGLGRIGRTILRQLAQDGGRDIELVHLNDIAASDLIAYLLRFDSTFGPFPGRIDERPGALVLDGRAVPITRLSDIGGLDLSGVDVLLDCTGRASAPDIARRGLDAGARAVLISGPSPAAEATVVPGANDAALGAARIVSAASCTTNALAPLLKALDGAQGVESAHMTTIHCYTGSQPMVDAPRGDMARSRAGALSMVPTTSSATRLIGEILPHLAGRISGAAVRVPTASVSAVDLVARLVRPLEGDPRELLRSLADASPVIGWTPWPNVSTDLRARPESVILALEETQAVGDRQLRVFGWYDNEWGFSARMLDMVRTIAARDRS